MTMRRMKKRRRRKRRKRRKTKKYASRPPTSDPPNTNTHQPNAATAISHISFSALAKAQASLSKDRRKPAAPSTSKTSKPTPATYFDGSQKAPTDPYHKFKKPEKRSSKNAPQEVSSKRAVTRKREVVEPASRQKSRDPRFDAAVNSRFDEHEFRKNYSFLDAYRDDEMKAMKVEIRKSKDERAAEAIAKTLKSMESRKQSQQNKDKLQEVLKEHKKKERELVKGGKKAYHLKEGWLNSIPYPQNCFADVFFRRTQKVGAPEGVRKDERQAAREQDCPEAKEKIPEGAQEHALGEADGINPIQWILMFLYQLIAIQLLSLTAGTRNGGRRPQFRGADVSLYKS